MRGTKSPNLSETYQAISKAEFGDARGIIKGYTCMYSGRIAVRVSPAFRFYEDSKTIQGA